MGKDDAYLYLASAYRGNDPSAAVWLYAAIVGAFSMKLGVGLEHWLLFQRIKVLFVLPTWRLATIIIPVTRDPSPLLTSTSAKYTCGTLTYMQAKYSGT